MASRPYKSKSPKLITQVVEHLMKWGAVLCLAFKGERETCAIHLQTHNFRSYCLNIKLILQWFQSWRGSEGAVNVCHEEGFVPRYQRVSFQMFFIRFVDYYRLHAIAVRC